MFLASSNFLVSFMLQLCIDAARKQKISELLAAGALFIIISIFCGIFYYLYEKGQERLKQEIAKKMKMTPNKARDLIHKNDKRRASYYNYYTSKKWGDSRGYDLTLDSGRIGVEGCVDIILAFRESLGKK